MTLVPTSSRGGLVDSVFGRTGAVVAATDDYTDAQVDVSPTQLLTAAGDTMHASAANTLARLAKGTDGQVYTLASGVPSWATPSGGVTILNYTEKTTNVTVSATAEATPTVIVTASAGVAVLTTDLICVEFYAPTTSIAASSSLLVNLWDDTAAASLGRMWACSAGNPAFSPGIFARRYFNPASNGTITYSIRGWRSGSDQTVVGGAGGATAYFPMYIRVSKGS